MLPAGNEVRKAQGGEGEGDHFLNQDHFIEGDRKTQEGGEEKKKEKKNQNLGQIRKINPGKEREQRVRREEAASRPPVNRSRAVTCFPSLTLKCSGEWPLLPPEGKLQAWVLILIRPPSPDALGQRSLSPHCLSRPQRQSARLIQRRVDRSKA